MKKYTLLFLLTVAGCLVRIPEAHAQHSDKLVYNHRFAPSEGLVNRTEKEYRQEICLNGYWDIQPQRLPDGYQMGKGVAPELLPPDAAAWSETRIKIPSPWNINAFANRNLEGPDHRNYPSYPAEWEEARMAWLRKSVTVPADWSGKRVKLYFESIAGNAEVYVGKQLVARNFDIFLPFEADVTEYARPGETVEVLVGVRDQALFEDRSTIGRRVIPAGSMWGGHIRGIWQDVYLYAVPEVHIADIFVKPLVSRNTLELEVTVRNNSAKTAAVSLQGVINEWLNKAGTDVNTAPVPHWELGRKALNVAPAKLTIAAGETLVTTLQVPIAEGMLDYWTPEHPNLYALVLSVNGKKQTIDKKYERFGWREWTIQGVNQCLNGKPYTLKGDSWHFMGIPQMTRRYAWAWFTAVKGMNGNAVRPHAQVYPRFYLDVADEMGVCILNETANWASDGGPKLDSDMFWQASKEHLRRFVLRDRNHASVFGWSISNENKPVILHVYNRPELMKQQEQAWKEWHDIVKKHDPTRPWISSDGEDDGNGILPVTVGHYGDMGSMKRWVAIGKPWGIGEHSMAYYGTPEQISKYNGEEAYASQYGRMKGLANECYHLLSDQRTMGASYISVFNMAWYALKPLPIGKKDLTTVPSLTADGVFFPSYTEGVPGVQPERMGPYCTTFNPGYDPALPLYDPWPLYDAMRAANAGEWSPYADASQPERRDTLSVQALKQYTEVVFIGQEGSALKQLLDAQGVDFTTKVTTPGQLLYIVDGTALPTPAQEKAMTQHLTKGADVWIWGIVPQTLNVYNRLLPQPLTLERREIASFIPENKSWMRGLKNSDFYFCEIQKSNASEYGLSGAFVQDGDVLLNACNTDWRKWNKRAEEMKTASLIRSEYEAKGAAAALAVCRHNGSAYYVSTLTEFANSEKGFNTLMTILNNAGIPCHPIEANSNDVFFLRDGRVSFPASTRERFTSAGEEHVLDVWVFSPRPLDDLLIEPNMPKLTLFVDCWQSALRLNDKPIEATQRTNRNATYHELPLLQGWNKLTLTIGKDDKGRFAAAFRCDNNAEFLPKMQVSFVSK